MPELRTTMLRCRALLLSYFTVAYNILEGLIALLAGASAGSIPLIGFGLDSFAESLSGGIMIWRFRQHGNISGAEEEHVERKATRLVAQTLFILGACVLDGSLDRLSHREPSQPSLIGIILAIASLRVMPGLA